MDIRNFRVIILFSLLINFVFALGLQANAGTLSDNLNKYIKGLPKGVVTSVYIESANKKHFYQKNPDRVVPAASIIKIPVLIEVMEQIEEKKFKLSDTLTLKGSDKVMGSGVIKFYKNGTKITIAKLAELMVSESDNTATNMLIKKVGMSAINKRMKNLGIKNTRMELLIMDLVAYSQGKDNLTTAKDTALLLKKIYLNQVATPALCKQMIEILKKTKNNRALPKYLKGITVAHKTGSLNNIQGDAGIVYSKTPFIISVFIQGMSVPQAEKVIADIGKISFDSIK